MAVTKFWTFDQNNSGGSFDFDEKSGITHYVIIEASSKSDAVKRAYDIGIYFDGCAEGRDCPCCGDRWHEPWGDDGDDAPLLYGQPLSKATGFQWMPDGKEIAVHYADERIEWFGVAKEAS